MTREKIPVDDDYIQSTHVEASYASARILWLTSPSLMIGHFKWLKPGGLFADVIDPFDAPDTD